MISVKIVSDNPHYDAVLRQVPGGGIPGFRFFINEEENECDALVVFDFARKDIRVSCDPANVWLWNMEPPDEEWEWLRKGYRNYSKVITVDSKIRHPKIINNQLAIPWQIHRTYDQLNNGSCFSGKQNDLSFITSNYAARKGHRNRLKFLDQIRGKLEFDLWGRGFRDMHDKADALWPYRYSLVIENSRYQDYWSEKFADALLCGTLPFYYGCPNISSYFSNEVFIPVDISKPAEAIDIIRTSISNGEWEKRRQAMESARKKILDEYQFFLQFARLFRQYGKQEIKREKVLVPKLSHHPSEIRPLSMGRNIYLLKKTLFKKRYLDPESPYFGFTAYK
jgi:hypothetical protein